MIIGQDYPELLRPDEVRVGQAKEPYATKTVLGWDINGPIDSEQKRGTEQRSYFVNTSNDLNIFDQSVQRFWKLDDTEAMTEKTSVSDRKVIKSWENSTV